MRVGEDEGECVCKIKRTILYRYTVRIRKVEMRTIIQRYL